MTGFIALYVFVLAAIAGYEIVARVPASLHVPLLSGLSFVHGIVLVGAMVALGHAQTALEQVFAFLAVTLAAGNAVGGYVITDRLLGAVRSGGRKK
ncbi:MAG: NAD(P) transhydrogenase subunit alpha [Gammaproteobacteria bacterium]